MTAPSAEQALKRFKRFKAGAQDEHDRVLEEASAAYLAYGGNSIQGKDYADLARVWGDYPPEVALILANVDAFWGSLIGSRREPTFPGFDMGPLDEVVGQLLTMLVKAGRRWAKSDSVDEGALMDLIIAGLGFSRLTLETDGRPPFRPKEQHITLDRMWWDPGCREKNMVDAQEFAVLDPFGVEEAAAKWPEHEDAIRALAVDGRGTGSAAGDGAQSVGGTAVSVKVTPGESGRVEVGDTTKGKRLREIQVFDFMYLAHEDLVSWEVQGPDGTIQLENTPEFFQEWEKAAGAAAAQRGIPFQAPPVRHFSTATWYRCPVLSRTISGEPLVLADPVPIPGNQRLVRVMTGKREFLLEGTKFKARWFGWGRILLPLQRLLSVAIRIEIEAESRRNRQSALVESDAFGGSQAEFERFVESRAIPGSVFKINPGDFERIHEVQENVGTRVAPMRELFEFFALDMPKLVLGMSDMNRGTFDSDRSVKLVSTMLETSMKMQVAFTAAFTDFLEEGAITMARLLLGPQGLDGADVDRILGAAGAPLREGINAEKDPQSGQLVPITDPETGAPMTSGAWLKKNIGQIEDHEINFALRPNAASERAASAQLLMQHGVLDTLLANVPPAGKRYVLEATLEGSFMEGTPFADLKTELDKVWDQDEAQQAQQQQVQTEDGWLQFIAQLGASDQQKAGELMQRASEAVLGPQGKSQPPGAQPAVGPDGQPVAGGGGVPGVPGAHKPPAESINFKDAPPEAQTQMLAQAGIYVAPEVLAQRAAEAEARKAALKQPAAPPPPPEGLP